MLLSMSLLWETGFNPAVDPWSTHIGYISELFLPPKGWGNVGVYPPTPVSMRLRVAVGALNPRACVHPPYTGPALFHWQRDTEGRERFCQHRNFPQKQAGDLRGGPRGGDWGIYRICYILFFCLGKKLDLT